MSRHSGAVILNLELLTVKPTIVIVEDDKAVRDSLRMVLETYGYAVEEFPTGEAFLDQERLDGERFVVLDVGLPGASGLEVLRRMRARQVALPTVVVSAREGAVMEEEALRFGALALLDKPIDIDALVAAIERQGGSR